MGYYSLSDVSEKNFRHWSTARLVLVSFSWSKIFQSQASSKCGGTTILHFSTLFPFQLQSPVVGHWKVPAIISIQKKKEDPPCIRDQVKMAASQVEMPNTTQWFFPSSTSLESLKMQKAHKPLNLKFSPSQEGCTALNLPGSTQGSFHWYSPAGEAAPQRFTIAKQPPTLAVQSSQTLLQALQSQAQSQSFETAGGGRSRQFVVARMVRSEPGSPKACLQALPMAMNNSNELVHKKPSHALVGRSLEELQGQAVPLQVDENVLEPRLQKLNTLDANFLNNPLLAQYLNTQPALSRLLVKSNETDMVEVPSNPRLVGAMGMATVTSEKRRGRKSKSSCPKAFLCPVAHCGYGFPTHFSLKRHLKRHSGQKPFQCTFVEPTTKERCTMAFAEKSTLKRHLQMHNGRRPYKCEFPGCNRRFADRVNLNRHLDKHSELQQMHSVDSQYSNDPLKTVVMASSPGGGSEPKKVGPVAVMATSVSDLMLPRVDKRKQAHICEHFAFQTVSIESYFRLHSWDAYEQASSIVYNSHTTVSKYSTLIFSISNLICHTRRQGRSVALNAINDRASTDCL
eukprot:g47954.t1